MKYLLILLSSLLCLSSKADVIYNSYASTNVTTSAYVTLSAATRTSFSKVSICDTSGKFLKLASGAAGSEHDLFPFGFDASNGACVVIPTYVPEGTRLSIKALSATASTGFLAIGLIE